MLNRRRRADQWFGDVVRSLEAAATAGDPGTVLVALRRLREIVGLLAPEDERVLDAAALITTSALPMLAQTGSQLSDALNTFRSLIERAVLPRDYRAGLLWNAGEGVLALARTSANAQYATDAANLCEAAVACTDPSSPVRVVALLTLGEALRLRSRLENRISDLDRAMAVYAQALDTAGTRSTDDAMWSLCQKGLGECLLEAFERTGQRERLDGAISALGTAVELADPDDPGASQSLSMAFFLRYKNFGDRADLDRALLIAAELVAASRDPDDENFMAQLNNLAAMLNARHDRTGDREDLDNAIEIWRRANQIQPENPTILSNLGAAFLELYELTGDSTMLTESVRLQDEAVRHSNELDPDHPRRLMSYATALVRWHQRHGQVAALDKAITALREALAASASSPGERTIRVNLSLALSERWIASGGTPDQHAEATVLLEQAARELPDGHPDRSKVMGNLSSLIAERDELNIVEQRAQRAGERAMAKAAAKRAGVDFVPDDDEPPDLAEINQTISLAEAAVQELPIDHPSRPQRLLQLGLAYGGRFDRTHNAEDLRAELDACAMVARDSNARAQVRAHAGKRWAWRAAAEDDWRSAAEGYRIAIEMLPYLASRDLQRDDQEHQLRAFSHLATAAAAAVLRCAGNPVLALELLEQGRGVMFAQAMRDQSELTALRDDTARLDALTAQVKVGPVVVVNISGYGCHALILTGQDVQAIPLTALTRQDVDNRAEAFRIALEVLDHAGFSAEDRWAASRFISRTLGWLWDVIAEPVLDRLGLAPGAPGSALPRLWWMPTGMLCFLPLHAAGHHTRRDGSTVMDRVVSSYTPTVRALRQAPATLSTIRPAAKSLVVAMPTTDGHHDLPDALREAADLRQLLPQVRVLTDRQACRAQVRKSIESSDLVHFACHAASDVDHPSSSHLLLADGRLTVRDIGALHIPDAYLAFLSACSTGRGSEKLPEEAIHVSSAFQLAGFPHVIATLWPIADDTAGAIAEHVYRTLTETPESGPARAVHAATRALRDARGGNTPVLWASHIHSGA
jgi:tetratricopeptide (TPR) repeat protein